MINDYTFLYHVLACFFVYLAVKLRVLEDGGEVWESSCVTASRFLHTRRVRDEFH